MADVDEAISQWIERAQDNLEAGFREVMLSPGMLLLGFILVIQWYVMPFFPRVSGYVGVQRFAGIKTLRDIGTCIIVFQLFFRKQLRALTLGSPFVASCLLILYTNYILFFIKERLLYNLYGEEYKNYERRRAKLVTNDYMDVSSDWSKVSLVFLVQLTLIMYYVRALNEAMRRWDEYNHGARFSTWALGVLVIVVTAHELGAPFAWNGWKQILQRFVEVDKHSSAGSTSRLMLRLTLVSRIYCDFIINSLCREIIIATAPLLLCLSGEFEFLKDVTAIAFIAKLDDLEPPQKVDDVFDAFAEQHGLVPASEQQYQRLDVTSTSVPTGEDGRTAGPNDDLYLWSFLCGWR